MKKFLEFRGEVVKKIILLKLVIPKASPTRLKCSCQLGTCITPTPLGLD